MLTIKLLHYFKRDIPLSAFLITVLAAVLVITEVFF